MRGDADELPTVLPGGLALRDQSQIDLVDERGGLESVAGTFAREVMVREATEFRVDEREKGAVVEESFPGAQRGGRGRRYGAT